MLIQHLLTERIFGKVFNLLLSLLPDSLSLEPVFYM
jgi:hypothetical protein